MAFFSKLFGRSQDRTLDRHFAEAKKQVDHEYGPMGEVSLAIVRAAMNSRDVITKDIVAPNEKARKQIEVFAFYEFLYFYLHMAMRAAASQLTEAQISKLQGYLGPLISSTAIDSYCVHWPTDLKQKMIAEFYDNLNNAELEYTECTRAIQAQGEEGAKQRTHALFMSMASTVAQLANDGHTDIAVVTVIYQAAVNEWAKMQLAKLMTDVKNAN